MEEEEKMEYELARILNDIQMYRRMDPYEENPNTSFIIHMLEKQYTIIQSSLPKRKIICNCCSKNLNDEKDIFELEDQVLCIECYEIKLNGPMDEDTEIVDMLNNLNTD
jgi:hypothetical protein